MSAAGAEVRGENGITYAYYFSDGSGGYEKVIRESSGRTVYSEKSFGVLEGAGCPAVLAEQCFVTNAADAEAFGSEAGCHLAAERYYRAICRYFGTQPTALEEMCIRDRISMAPTAAAAAATSAARRSSFFFCFTFRPPFVDQPRLLVAGQGKSVPIITEKRDKVPPAAGAKRERLFHGRFCRAAHTPVSYTHLVLIEEIAGNKTH